MPSGLFSCLSRSTGFRLRTSSQVASVVAPWPDAIKSEATSLAKEVSSRCSLETVEQLVGVRLDLDRAAGASATCSGVFRPSPVTSSTTRSLGPTCPSATASRSAPSVTPAAVSPNTPVVSASSAMFSPTSLLRHGVDRAAGRARGLDREVAVGRVADRERARDRVRPHRPDAPAVGERASRPASSPRPGRRAAAAACPSTRPSAEQLVEPLAHLREHRARGDRRDDDVRQLPSRAARRPRTRASSSPRRSTRAA